MFAVSAANAVSSLSQFNEMELYNTGKLTVPFDNASHIEGWFWENWSDPASVAFDSAFDASGNASSGSMRWSASLANTSNYQQTALTTGLATPLPLEQIQKISFDLKVDTATSTTRSNGSDYGNLEIVLRLSTNWRWTPVAWHTLKAGSWTRIELSMPAGQSSTDTLNALTFRIGDSGFRGPVNVLIDNIKIVASSAPPDVVVSFDNQSEVSPWYWENWSTLAELEFDPGTDTDSNSNSGSLKTVIGFQNSPSSYQASVITVPISHPISPIHYSKIAMDVKVDPALSFKRHGYNDYGKFEILLRSGPQWEFTRISTVQLLDADWIHIEAIVPDEFSQAHHLTLWISENGYAGPVTLNIDNLAWVEDSELPDTTPPTVSVPSDIIVEAASTVGTSVQFTASATDEIDGEIPVTLSHASGFWFPLGTTTVTALASDTKGNISTRSFKITVQDSTPPFISAPQSIIEEATSASGAVVNFTTSAADIVDGFPATTAAPAPGSMFPLGTTTVQVDSVDARGNRSSKSFEVLVQDTLPPDITVPEPITVEASGSNGAAAHYVVSSTDRVDGSITPLVEPLSGSRFPLGSSIVSAIAMDAHGNISTKEFSVTVVDTTPPVIVSAFATKQNGSSSSLAKNTMSLSAKLPITISLSASESISSLVLWPPNHELIPVNVHVDTHDIVDAAPSSRIVQVTSNEPISGTSQGDTSPDWEITGPLTLKVRAERAGNGVGRVYSVVVETRDFSGNIARKVVTISVPRDQSAKR